MTSHPEKSTSPASWKTAPIFHAIILGFPPFVLHKSMCVRIGLCLCSDFTAGWLQRFPPNGRENRWIFMWILCAQRPELHRLNTAISYVNTKWEIFHSLRFRYIMNGVPEAQSENIKFLDDFTGWLAIKIRRFALVFSRSNEIPSTSKWKNDSFRKHGA